MSRHCFASVMPLESPLGRCVSCSPDCCKCGECHLVCHQVPSFGVPQPQKPLSFPVPSDGLLRPVPHGAGAAAVRPSRRGPRGRPSRGASPDSLTTVRWRPAREPLSRSLFRLFIFGCHTVSCNVRQPALPPPQQRCFPFRCVWQTKTKPVGVFI